MIWKGDTYIFNSVLNWIMCWREENILSRHWVGNISNTKKLKVPNASRCATNVFILRLIYIYWYKCFLCTSFRLCHCISDDITYKYIVGNLPTAKVDGPSNSNNHFFNHILISWAIRFSSLTLEYKTDSLTNILTTSGIS